jgi:hypothetical protein
MAKRAVGARAPYNPTAKKKVAKKKATKKAATKPKVEEPLVEVPAEEPEPQGPFVFRTPHPGLKQVLKPAGYDILGPNDHVIIPPILAEFEAVPGGRSGVWETDDPELAELMRKKIARKTIVDVVEVTGEGI